MLIEAQLVIHLGGDQCNDKGESIDQDCNASGLECQELLHLPPIEFGYVIAIQDGDGANDCQQVEDHVERLGQGRVELNEAADVHGALKENENHDQLPESQTCEEPVAKYA